MSDPLMCEVEPVGGDGLIDPELFVIRSVMLPSAASQIEAAGEWLTRMGDDLAATMGDISAEWWKLPGCYEAPEASEVYLLLNPACEDADLVRATLGSAALLLEDYSAAVAAERAGLRDLSARAEVFRREVLGTSWREDGANIARNTALLEEHAGIAHRINAAAVTCANGIYALLGTLPDGHVAPEVVPEWALASPDLPMPWGYPVEEDRNWLESLGHVFWRFGNEFGTSVAGLTGYDTLTNERTGAFAGQAWAGLGNGLGSLLVSVVGAPLVLVSANADEDERNGLMRWFVERGEVATTAVAGMAAIDYQAGPGSSMIQDWHDDPIAAGGYTLLNGASLFAGIGVLSAGRAAIVASRLGAMSARTARIAALAGQAAEFVIPASEIFTAGGIRVFASLRNAIRLAEFDGLTINPAAFVDEVAGLADVAPVDTSVSDELFGGADSGSVDVGGMPDGELDSVDQPDSAVGPDESPPNGPPSDGGPGSGGAGGGGDDPTPQPFEPDKPVPMTADASAAPRPWTQADLDHALEDAPVNADGLSLDHRTGTPLDLTGEKSGWTLRWSEADGQWFVENLDPPARVQPATGDSLTDSMRTAGPIELDLSRADLYDSGDVLHPGDYPPGTPAETFDASGGTEGIVHSKLRNGDGWRTYQEQISGWEPTADGLVPEYRRINPATGTAVDFDGRAARPDGKTAMLEAKFGHRELVFDPEGAFATRVRVQLPQQMRDRLRVLGPDEVLEYHVSDPYGAAGVQAIVDEAKLGARVVVIYTPAA